MTHDEIEVMPAGRELDAMIAEELIGWKWYSRKSHDLSFLVPPDAAPEWLEKWCNPSHRQAERFEDWDAMQSFGSKYHRLPRYSTDIAAAWTVAEAMHEAGYWLRLQSPFEPGSSWRAGFTVHGCSGFNGRPDHEAGADTPALAICRAALLTAAR